MSLYCSQCGDLMFVVDGVSYHMKDGVPEIDHDKDAHHVAIVDDSVDDSPNPNDAEVLIPIIAKKFVGININNFSKVDKEIVELLVRYSVLNYNERNELFVMNSLLSDLYPLS